MIRLQTIAALEIKMGRGVAAHSSHLFALYGMEEKFVACVSDVGRQLSMDLCIPTPPVWRLIAYAQREPGSDDHFEKDLSDYGR